SASSEDFALLLASGIADRNPHDEAVELRLGKGIGAFQINRVLRSDDQERHLKWEGLPFNRDLALLHCLEQRRLSLGRRAIDLIGEQELGKNWTAAELELSLALIVQEAAGDVARKQVRRELDPLEGKIECLAEEARNQCLGQPGIILDQDMSIRENT